ncbi:hypothetical protein CIB48_g6157 [Xylaria polymorpha]|nr:hypothetical protein CIB48_g6157 [Xylaria polymorpha]
MDNPVSQGSNPGIIGAKLGPSFFFTHCPRILTPDWTIRICTGNAVLKARRLGWVGPKLLYLSVCPQSGANDRRGTGRFRNFREPIKRRDRGYQQRYGFVRIKRPGDPEATVETPSPRLASPPVLFNVIPNGQGFVGSFHP